MELMAFALSDTEMSIVCFLSHVEFEGWEVGKEINVKGICEVKEE